MSKTLRAAVIGAGGIAVHGHIPGYRATEDVQVVTRLLSSRFFQPDTYTSYHAASYWLKFRYPFWWYNLVTALDSLSLIGMPREDEQIKHALGWLVDHQKGKGLWRVSYTSSGEKKTTATLKMQLWVSLAICRVFKRFWCAPLAESG